MQTKNHMTNEGKTVEELLEERAAVYSSYAKGVRARGIIVNAMVTKYLETRSEISDDLRIMFGDLALKLMRFSADPLYEDSLQDLQGYAKLINNVMQGKDNADN